MKKETWSHMLGCAIGAFIGALITFEIHSRIIWGEYLWILGAFVGGIAGWCMGEFGELWTSIERAYREVINWKPDKIYWRAVRALSIGYLSLSLSFGLISFLLLFLYGDQIQGSKSLGAVVLVFVILMSGSTSLTCVVFAFLVGPFSFCKKGIKETREEYEERLRDEEKNGWNIFKFGNPLSLPVFLVIWFYRGARYLLRNVSPIVREIIFVIGFAGEGIGQFFVHIVIYAHSEKRRIRFIGAFLGTVAGFFLGSAILGAVAGAIIGGISRELIAIRWLKLIPAKAG